MRHSKRYVVLWILLIMVFLLKFHFMEAGSGVLEEFRGGSLSKDVWYPLVAKDVNGKELKLIIDSREYTSNNYTFYMDSNRNIMVPVTILRDALNCSSHIYGQKQLLVEKYNATAQMKLGEDFGYATGVATPVVSPLTKIKDDYYVSLNDLSNLLGYQCSFDVTANALNMYDTLGENATLPAKYDLRDRYRISEIRNQGKYGTCWAFAALSALESTLLPEQPYIFSVDHMSMCNSFRINQEDGGNYTMSMAYLAAWQGPVYEADDPYGDGQTNAALTAVKHVQEMRIIASKDIRSIKEAVFKYGGVQTSIYTNMSGARDSSKYYNEETYSYCYIGTEKPNHDVVIIGWDDNYSKKNFDMPLEGDGAFICQNSWGTAFGDDGIFYVSYYDSNIGTHNVVYTRIDDNDNYDRIYQSDYCGWVGKIGYEKESIYGANVYTAKTGEDIVATGFYATAPDTEYKVYVVKDFKDSSSFLDKELVAEGSFKEAGYYTVDFDKQVAVEAGERFAVVVYVKTPGATHPMAIEYDTGASALEGVVLDDGESYISYGGQYFTNVKEKQECNLCIKAFTREKR